MTRIPLAAWMLPLTIGAMAAGAVSLPAVAEVLYVASPNRIWVVDSETGKQLADMALGHTTFDIAFSADRTRAYLATSDGVMEVDATKHAVLGRLLPGPSFRVELAPDGKLLYVLGNGILKRPDGQQEALPSELTTFDLATRKVAAKREVGLGAEDLAMAAGRAAVTNPKAHALALVSPGDAARAATQVSLATGNPESPGFVRGLATSPDGREIYVGQFGEASQIHVVDAASGSERELSFPHEGFITGVAVTADGKNLLVATRNHLAVLDPATGSEKRFIALGGAHAAMTVSARGSYSYHATAAYNDQGGAVTAVNLASGEVRAIPTPGMSPFTIGVMP
jgi:DNA-binding beta-propeller fold protein YncE